MKPLLLFFSLGLLASCSQKLTSIALSHDQNVNLPLANNVQIGATFLYSNGKEKKTKSLFQGNKAWYPLEVSVKGGTFKNGNLLIDYAQAAQNGNKISVSCRHKRYEKVMSYYEIPVPKPVSMKIAPSTDVSAPGIPIPLVFKISFEDGKKLQVNSNDNIRFLKDLTLSYGNTKHAAHLPIFLPRNKEKYPDSIAVKCFYAGDTTTIGQGYFPLNYKASYELKLLGSPGGNGSSGSSGRDDGQHGQDGGNGGSGGSVPPLQVWISTIGDTTAHLASVVTSVERHVEYYIIDYRSQAQINIIANGGNGGHGGSGGNGGDGMDQTDKRAAGKGGDGGNGGNGGDGGNGADVTMHVERGLEAIADQIVTIKQEGGVSGSGGSGARGGRNGNKLKQSTGNLISKIIGFERGRNGSDGSNGRQGRKGNTRMITLDHETIQQDLSQLGN